MTKHGRTWRFLFVLHLYAFLGVLALVIILAGSVTLAWKVPSARRFVHSELAKIYLRKVAPKLPFTIEDVSVDANWSEFKRGWISNFGLHLRWNDWTLQLAGPIQVAWDHDEGEKHLSATYLSKILVRGPAGEIPEFPLRIAFRAEENFSHLDSLTLQTSLPEWTLERYHLKLQDFSMGATWSESVAHVSISAKSVSVTDPVHQRSLKLADLTLSSISPLKLKPLQIGPAAQIDFTATQAQTMWDEKVLRLPLSRFPVHAVLSLSAHPDSPESEDSLDLVAGKPTRPDLKMSARLFRQKKTPTQLRLNWKTPEIPLRELLSALPSLLNGADPFHPIRKPSGSVKTQGDVLLPLPLNADTAQVARIDGRLVARDVSFEWPEKYLAIGGLNLDLPISTKTGLQGTVSASQILFRRFQGSLSSARLVFSPTDSSRKFFRISLDTSSLRFKDLPLKLGNIQGTLQLPEKKGEPGQYKIDAAVNLASTEVSRIAHGFCLSTEHIPPAQVEADFPEIDFTPGTVAPTGKFQAHMFKGNLVLSEIGLYDLGTPVPEVDLDVSMDGVRLDQLGDWAGFGKMDGTLSAYAHDVVFQGWLPTQYDFKFQASPFSQTKIVFSPDAMKNLARLVASDAIDHLPAFANWMAFGFPSRMLGGFDIWFVGISLFSRDGHILLEVLDPPDLPINVAQEHKQNHYILYANRFTIPLKTSQYPVVVDATAVSNYVHSATLKLLKLRQIKKAKEKAQHEKEPMDCDPPSL